MNSRKWDTDRARELFEEGKSDLEIAEAVGATRSAVYNWRIKNRLLRQPVPPPKIQAQTPDSVAMEPPALEPVSQDTAPRSSGPVELHLELDGGWARLRAPSWEQAARLWRMLDVCVEALRTEERST